MDDARTPCVLVSSTSHAEALAQCNGRASLAALLSAHGAVAGLNAQVRTVNDSWTHTIKYTKLRFYSPSTLAQPALEDAEAELKAIVSNAGDAQAGQLASPRVRDSFDAASVKANWREPAPWFAQYRSKFLDVLRCYSFEFFDQPVAHLAVLCASEVEPATVAQQFRTLAQQAALPAVLTDGTYSDRLPVFCVLLYDNAPGVADAAQLGEIKKALDTEFNPGECSMLQINSGGKGASAPPPGAAGRAEGAPEPQGELGLQRMPGDLPTAPDACLTDSDRQAIAGFMMKFAGEFVVPKMERRLREMYPEISAARKGLKNQWKSWFGSKKPDASREGVVLTQGRAPVYKITSLESQTRLFADMAYMLQDWELAKEHYKMVSADYKTDKAYMAFAGTQEMVAMCLLKLDGNRSDIVGKLEDAIAHYARGKEPGAVRLGTRTTLELVDCLRSRMLHGEATKKLVAAADIETDLRAAILLEQAAYCFLANSPKSQFRKYGFHLVLAGYRYNLAQQRRHTVRCYAVALFLYNNSGWSHIEDHLNFALGRQSRSLHDYANAMQYLVALLKDCHQPADRQQAFLKEFLVVAKTFYGSASSEAISIPLPKMIDSSVKVVTDAVPKGGGREEEQWQTMQLNLAEAYTVKAMAQPGARRMFGSGTSKRCGYVGEIVHVTLTAENPLMVPLALGQVKLICELQAGGELREGGVEMQTIDLELEPGAKRVFSLQATPVAEGEMTIVGVEWHLAGELRAVHNFNLQGPRLNKTKQHKTSVMYAPNTTLQLAIRPSMPLLQVQFGEGGSGLPTSMVEGEMRCVPMTVTNVGITAALHSVTVMLSDPGLCFVGEGEATEFPQCLPKAEQLSSRKIDAADFSDDVSLVTLPVRDLAPGQSAVVPVWLYGRTPGHKTLNLLYMYDGHKAEGAKPEDSSRTHRVSHNFEVSPALKLAAALSPTADGGAQLTMEVRNDSAEEVNLQQLSCISAAWKIELGAAAEQSSTLQPRHSTWLQVRLKRSAEQADSLLQSNLALRAGEGALDCMGPEIWSSVVRGQSEVEWMRWWAVAQEREFATQMVRFVVLWSTTDAGVNVAGHSHITGSVEANDAVWSIGASPTDGVPVVRRRLLKDINATYDEVPGWQGRAHLLDGLPPAPPAKRKDDIVEILLPDGTILKTSQRSEREVKKVQRKDETTKAVPVALCPAKLSLEGPSEVVHDFESSALCEVGFVIRVQNTSSTFALDLTVGVDSPIDVDGPSGVYVWSGQTRATFATLAPGESRSVELRACFGHHGIFELAQYSAVVSWDRFRSTIEPTVDHTLLVLPVEEPEE